MSTAAGAVAQAGRPATAATPLGGDALVVVRVAGTEELSRPFLFTVDFVSREGGVAPAALLGKPMALSFELPEGGARPVHGLVRRWTALGSAGPAGLFRYRAELVPWVWMLSLSSDCRTFERQSPLDVIEAVFTQAGYHDFRRRVASPPPVAPYVVQYDETDLAFVSRLLEDAGLYYTFEHSADKHTLVLTDARGGAVPAGQVASVPIVGPEPHGGNAGDVASVPNAITGFERDYVVHARAVALGDAHLLRAADRGSSTSDRPGAAGERFAFLGDLDGTPEAGVAAARARRRIEAEEALGDVAHGTSSCPGLAAGTRVTVTGGPHGAAGADYQIVRVTHALEIGDVAAGGGLTSKYENTFTAMPAATLYRPASVTPRPAVRGTQTALVVGAGGAGQIDVDAHGCILLQFPWDRGAGKDGRSQHRVHVASVWSGTGWGAVQLPRLGQRVLVEYLGGDPERPIVTGRVYTSDNAHPYGLPGSKTQSGIKTRSVGGGADNCNELRFEDKQGDEHVYLQAEKDLQVHVKHDETREVLNDRTATITNNETLTVKQGDRTATVEMGNDALAVKMGNLTIGVSLGNVSIKADVGSITLEALQGVTLKSGPMSSLQVTPAGITVKGAMVSLEGQVTAQIKAPMVQASADAMLMAKGAITMIG